MKKLESIPEVIVALGGATKVARITFKNTQAVSNWSVRGHIPARAFDDIEKALRRKKYTVERSLFGFDSSLRKRKAA
jgi:hypothetical protein